MIKVKVNEVDLNPNYPHVVYVLAHLDLTYDDCFIFQS